VYVQRSTWSGGAYTNLVARDNQIVLIILTGNDRIVCEHFEYRQTGGIIYAQQRIAQVITDRQQRTVVTVNFEKLACDIFV